jgi:hypothetical protein
MSWYVAVNRSLDPSHVDPDIDTVMKTPTGQMADGVKKIVDSLASIIIASIKTHDHLIFRSSERLAQNRYEKCCQEFAAAASKATALFEVLRDETYKMSPAESAAMARSVKRPMLREAIASRDFFAKLAEQKRINPSELQEIDHLIDRFGYEAFSVNIHETPTPHTSAAVAIAAIRQQREKLEALDQSAAELKKIQSQ